jgi:nitroreductase
MIEASLLKRGIAMQDVVTHLETRRSVSPQNMTVPGPSSAELERILNIAARVPDHGKLAPWRFIVFEGAARETASQGLADILARRDAEPERVEFAKRALTDAPLVIAVVSKAGAHEKIPEWEQVLSAGAAAMNLVHAAHALGYATTWLTGWYAYDPEATAFLGLKPGERFAGLIHIGTAKEPPRERPRPPLADIVTRWGA